MLIIHNQGIVEATVKPNNTKKNPKLVAVELRNHAANLIYVVINWKVKEKWLVLYKISENEKISILFFVAIVVDAPFYLEYLQCPALFFL